MRPTRHRRNTHKGLGEGVEDPSQDETPPPPSSRGVIAVTPSVAPAGRYSVRPATSQTREFKSPLEGGGTRRPTAKMPAHVEEARAAAGAPAITSEGAVRRRDPGHALEQAPLGSREAFVLSHVEGSTSVSSLIDVTAMSESEVLAIIERLVGLGLLSIE